MPLKLNICDADEHYQDYEWADAVAKFFASVAMGDTVQLTFEADPT